MAFGFRESDAKPGKNGMKEMQPRFSPIEEARKQFQIAANKDPLEAATWQALREQAKLMQDQVAPNIGQEVQWSGFP
jgi:hypothetical protein